MEKKIAEFIGIMIGDGSIGIYNCKAGNRIKKHRVVKVSLDSRNEQYTNHVANIMKEVLGIEPKIHYKKNEHAVDICIYKKGVFKHVTEKIGLKKSPKWNTMKIPKKQMNCLLSCFVLRGLFDTDGCLSIFNNNGILYPRIEIKMCPSPAQKQVSEILNNLKIRHTIQNLEKGKTRIRISGKEELGKWFNFIGSSNIIHIEKAEKILKRKVL